MSLQKAQAFHSERYPPSTTPRLVYGSGAQVMFGLPTSRSGQQPAIYNSLLTLVSSKRKARGAVERIQRASAYGRFGSTRGHNDHESVIRTEESATCFAAGLAREVKLRSPWTFPRPRAVATE